MSSTRRSAVPAHNANGHRRRQLRARVFAEESQCALCLELVDKSLRFVRGRHGPRCKGECSGCSPHPRRGEVDEDVPRSRGGDPLDRANCHLMHRECNRWKSKRTIAECRAIMNGTHVRTPVVASAFW